MMLGGSEVDELTAWHTDVLGHATPTIVLVPDGMVSEFQLVPPFVVPIRAPVPKMPKPTAVQVETLGHDRPFNPLISVGSD